MRKLDTSVSNLSVARALTWRYAIALLLVATLSTAAWLSLHLVISEQKSTAAVVNVSGRQRMLSQRTAFFSNLLVHAPKAERALIRSKLKDAIDLMLLSHHGLIHGDAEMGLPETMSPVVRSMYFDGPNSLNGQVETYIGTVNALLLLSDDKLTGDIPQLQYIVDTAPTTLVAALDKMVNQYQLEGEASVGGLQRAETTFWAVTLLLLMLEALLIFRPFVRHVRVIIDQLQQVTGELQLHRDRLEQLVGQRTAELERRGEALIESEEKFRLISFAAQDAIAIIGPDERVVYWNPAAEKIFGYSVDEAAGKNLHVLIAPTHFQDSAHSGFEQFRQSGHGNLIGKTFEITALRKGGGEFPIELSISAIKLQDSWHAMGIIRDITERNKSEYALKRSNADLERFAYSVSHDMRQPLRAISGHLQLLQRSLKDKLDDDERENMQFALEGAQRMDSMIVSLLDYSRVGRKTETKQWIASRKPLDEALGFLEPMIAEAHAQLSLNGEWPQVFASRDELMRLFQNLIGNAIKFHEAGQVPRVEIDSSLHGLIWRVSVKDHGVGINPQHIDRLFQFFSRLQSRVRFEGTGMGLALCRRIVEHHGGRIWVESAGEGLGSTFVFEFELPKSPEAEKIGI